MRRFHLDSGAALLVAVRGSWTDDEMTAGGGVVPQPRQKVVIGDQQAGYDEHRQLRGHGGGFEKPAAVRSNDLDIVDQPRRHSRVEGASVEGIEDPMVGPAIDVLWRPDAVPLPGCGKAA